MEQWEAVRPIGPAWTVMGSNPVSASTFVPCATGKYLIAPLGSNIAFLGYGPTSAAAQTNAQNLMLATGSVQNCIPITWGPPADSPRVFTLGGASNPPGGNPLAGLGSSVNGMFFAALTQGGTGTAPIVIIPCDGI